MSFSKPIIQALQEWLETCPLLGERLIRLDFLDGEAGSFSIITEPTDKIIRQYIDGPALCRYNFAIVSNELYSPDKQDAIVASGFYEQMADWIALKNEQMDLPDVPGIQSVEVDMPGYLYIAEADVGRYQITAHLTYIK